MEKECECCYVAYWENDWEANLIDEEEIECFDNPETSPNFLMFNFCPMCGREL